MQTRSHPLSGAAGGDGRPRQARRPFGICSSVWRRAGVPAATRAPAGAGLGEADGEVHCLPGRTAPDCQVEPGRPHWDGPVSHAAAGHSVDQGDLVRDPPGAEGVREPLPASMWRSRLRAARGWLRWAPCVLLGVGAGRAQRPRRRPDDVDVNYHRVVDLVNAVARAAARPDTERR